MSSNDTKLIQTSNLAVTPQPMTATLIFRRQLVRPKPDLLTASSTADKLPLEKFHRLLDLVFWVKFLKFETISCFVFLWDVYRVSPFPVASERANRGRGENNNPEPPPAHVLILDMFTLSTTVYHVLQRLTLFTLSTTVYNCLQCLTTSYNVLH